MVESPVESIDFLSTYQRKRHYYMQENPNPYPIQPQWIQQSQAPRPRRNFTWLWILALIGALVIGYAAGSSRSSGTTATITSAQPTTLPAARNTSAPAQSTQHFSVGQTIKTGDGDWEITINGVKTSQGQDFSTPKAGNIFLLIDVTLKNTSKQTQQVSNLAMFTLRDLGGLEYTQTILPSAQAAPNGQADPGQPIRGTLPFEVPTSQHAFTLAFIGHLADTQQVLFDIKV